MCVCVCLVSVVNFSSERHDLNPASFRLMLHHRSVFSVMLVSCNLSEIEAAAGFESTTPDLLNKNYCTKFTCTVFPDPLIELVCRRPPSWWGISDETQSELFYAKAFLLPALLLPAWVTSCSFITTQTNTATTAGRILLPAAAARKWKKRCHVL